jgi:hypothetical protein
MKTDAKERAALVAAASSAFRARSADGEVLTSPAWLDLDEAGRVEAFDATSTQRSLEAALDPAGLSTTARAVLARIRRPA